MFKISLNRVHDTVQIKEGEETLRLRVDGDAARMAAGLINTRELLTAGEADVAALDKAAHMFAETIFGAEQAGRLFDFYHGSTGCVLNICGTYFNERLGKLITNAQKKSK